MAITSVIKLADDNASITLDGQDEVLNYIVETDSIATTPSDTLTADDGVTAIPEWYSQHPTKPTLLALDIRATRDPENPTIFRVTVTYKVPPPSQWQEIPPVSSVTPWGTSLAVRGVEYVEPIDKDRLGRQLETSARQPFPLSVNKVFYDEELLIRFNIRRINAAMVAAKRGTVNSDAVTMNMTRYQYQRTFAKKTLKLGNISYSTGNDPNGSPYFQVELPLLYRSVTVKAYGDTVATEHGWDRLIVDQGFHKLTSNKPVRIVEQDSSGNDIPGVYKATPSFLDGQGGLLSSLTFGHDAVLLPWEIEDVAALTPLLAGIA